MKIFVVFLLLLILCSCGRKGNLPPNGTDTDTIKVIDLLPLTDSIITNLSVIASDIRYIPLHTPGDIRITGLFKIVSCADKIYINSGRNIICFDNNGHFLYAINPGDSIDFISDFDICSGDTTVVVLSGKNILTFKNTGTEFVFQKSVSLKSPLPSKIDIVPKTSNILLSIIPSRGNEPSLTLLINTNGDTLILKPNCYKFRKTDKTAYGTADEIIHYKTGKYLCFKERFSDTIFSVSKGSNRFSPWLILNSEGKSFPARARGNMENANDIPEEYSDVERIFEVSNYIFYNYSYVYNKAGFAWHRKIIYDRRTDRKIEIELNKDLTDDICGGPDFDPVSVSEGKLYSFLDASILKFYITGDVFKNAIVKYPDRKKALRRLSDSLKISDNPVVVIVTPKD